MDEVSSFDIGYGYYIRVARGGNEGNASEFPFIPEKKDWKKHDELNHLSRENCMDCNEFADCAIKMVNRQHITALLNSSNGLVLFKRYKKQQRKIKKLEEELKRITILFKK